MPPRWIHETVDLIAFGRSYWRLHQWKDAPARECGVEHRRRRHGWYQRFPRDWDHAEPFPSLVLHQIGEVGRRRGAERAEEFQAFITHDYLDRIWDELKHIEREQVAAELREALLDTEWLLSVAGVDTATGRIKVRRSQDDGFDPPLETWDFVPTLRRDYVNIKSWVESRSLATLLYQT